MGSKINTRANRVAIGSIIMVILSLGCYISLSVYVMPLSQALEVSVGQISLLFTFTSMGSLVISLLIGKILKKISIKILVSIGGLLTIIFFSSIYFSPNILLIYIVSCLFGIAITISGITTAQIAITWWFIKGRGTLMSALNIGIAAFGVTIVPIIAKQINVYGPQKVALWQGIIAGIGIIIVGIFLLSDHPHKYGLKPVGYVNDEIDKNKDKGKDSKEDIYIENNMSLGQIIKTPAFWMIIVATVAISMAMSGFTNNASTLYQSIGLDPISAAYAISIYNAGKLFWAPAYGFVVDKFGPGFATSVFGLITAVIFFCSIILSGLVGAFTIAFFMGSASFSAMLGAISFPKVFVTKEAANLLGISFAASSIGMMIGSPVAGFMYDIFESFNIFMIFSGILMIITVVLTYVSTSNKTVEKVKLKQTKLMSKNPEATIQNI